MNEVQCPNCKSFHTNSQTPEKNIKILQAVGGLSLIFIVLGFTAKDLLALWVMLFIVFFIITIIYAYKTYKVKSSSGYCKACNYRWKF